jgi:hypothetical protein
MLLHLSLVDIRHMCEVEVGRKRTVVGDDHQRATESKQCLKKNKGGKIRRRRRRRRMEVRDC